MCVYIISLYLIEAFVSGIRVFVYYLLPIVSVFVIYINIYMVKCTHIY